MQKSNRELFENFGIIDTTWRRWSREFLPPDPEAGLRKGRTRMYTAEDAFLVWAGGRLLTDHQLTYDEAKEALSVLEPFMREQGLFPLRDVHADTRRKKTGGPAIEYWNFCIERRAIGNRYYAVGIIEEKMTGGKNPMRFSRDYLLVELSGERSSQPVICMVEVSLLRWISIFGKLSGFPTHGVASIGTPR